MMVIVEMLFIKILRLLKGFPQQNKAYTMVK